MVSESDQFHNFDRKRILHLNNNVHFEIYIECINTCQRNVVLLGRLTSFIYLFEILNHLFTFFAGKILLGVFSYCT